MGFFRKLIFLILKFITVYNYSYVKKFYKKIIFLHIPHCGGNTIHKFLKINFGLRGKKIILTDNKNISFLEDSKNHYYNFGHFGYDYIKENYYDKNFFYIVNIRKPKNFYLSNYFRDLKFHKIYKAESSFPTFEEYLKINKKNNKDNIFCRYLSGEFIYKKNRVEMSDEILEKAIKNLESFNFFFVLENSNECLNYLPKKLKIPLNYASIFKIHTNKHSDSIYPKISKEEEKLLESMVRYDNKLYEVILKKKNL